MDVDKSSYLLIIFLAFVLLTSGCVSDTTDNPQAENSPQPSDETSGDSTSSEADISLKSMNVPEEVEMGENFTLEATFQNNGGESGDFKTTVMIRGQDEQTFSSTGNKIEGVVGARKEETFETSLEAEGVSSSVIGLAGTDAESTCE